MKNSTQNKIYFSVVAGLGLLAGLPTVANAAPAGDDAVSGNNSTTRADSLGLNSATGTNVSIVGGANTNIRSTGDTIVTVDSDEGGAFGKFTVIDKLNAGATDDGIWVFDAETGFSSKPSPVAGTSTLTHTATGGVNVTGAGAAADIKSVSGATHATINHAKASGSHTVGTDSNAWFFDHTGSEETTVSTGTTAKTKQTSSNRNTKISNSLTKYTAQDQTSTNLFDDLMDGGNHHTSTRTASSRTDTITNGTDTTYHLQDNTMQYDLASDSAVTAFASRIQTKYGQTDTAAVIGSTATRAQTATTQDDGIVDTVTGFSNNQNSTVAGTTRTVVGVGTTISKQTDQDIELSTVAGPNGSRVFVNNSEAELSHTNVMGNKHGVFVGENSTRISGGTNSTSLAFDDNGAHFRNDATGGPARVTGVADGVADFDAVNFRQLNALDGKLTKKINETGAVAAAFAQLGQAQTPGKSTFGIAGGGQGGKAALALGFSHRPISMKPVVIKASIGAAGSTTSGGIGATWEF